MLKPSSLVGPISDAARRARRVSVDVIHQTAVDDPRRALVSEAKDAGLATEARGAERAVHENARDAGLVEGIERVLVRQRPGLHTMGAVLRAASPARPTRLERLFALFSQRDRIEIVAIAERLMRGGKRLSPGRLNNMAGALREVLVKALPEVVVEVDRATASLRARATGSGVLSPIDSAFHGAVQLPTRLKGGERSVKLGTDRLVGMGRIEPQRVDVVWSDGTRDAVDIAGVLDVTLAVEIKGRTTATEGLEQLRALQQRGEPAYANIGGQLWLLNYDASRVTHLLVAPAGENLSRAREAARRATEGGLLTKVVAIPRELDDEVIELAKGYLEAAAQLVP